MLNRLGTPQLLVSSALLLGVGTVMVYSASAVRAEAEFGSSTVYLFRQLEGIALGLALGAIASRVPLALLRRAAPLAWLAGTLLVAATLTPLGLEQKGASRWLGVAGWSFQPLEVCKLSVVTALAWWLAGVEAHLRDFRFALLAPGLIAGIPAGLLLLQPDFGGALLLLLAAGTLAFAAGARILHLVAIAALALPGIAYIAMSESYRMQRLAAFTDPWGDPLGSGYQLVQSLLAFGAGGMGGVGLGAGQQKLGYLPEAHTDFVLSVVGEELGLVGVVAVLALYLVLGLSSLAIASRSRDRFSQLLALGASLLIWLQGAVNAGVALGALPTKGTTLPLFSSGRSSLAASLVAIGLVLNAARPAKEGRAGWR